ncbi:hypothetical protein D3C76_1507410 [compost metagenome]
MRVVQRRLRHAWHAYQEFTTAGDFQEVTDKSRHSRRVIGRRTHAVAQMATGALQLIVHAHAVAGLGDGLLQFLVAGGVTLRRVRDGPGLDERGAQDADETEDEQLAHEMSP